MEINDVIISIINAIESGTLFDSHYIIDELRSKHLDIYKSHKTKNQKDHQYHGVIANAINYISENKYIIRKINNVKILELKNDDGKVLSLNINNNKSLNQLWVKLWNLQLNN